MRSILLLSLAARYLETMDVCIRCMFACIFVVVTVHCVLEVVKGCGFLSHDGCVWFVV